MRPRSLRLDVLLASVFVAVAVAIGAGSSLTATAEAAGCAEGNRDQARAIAATGRYRAWMVRWTVATVVGVHPGRVRYVNLPASVELRFDPVTRCAWGVAGGAFNHVYLDRSQDGGRTWQGWIGKAAKTSGGTAFTGVFDDARPYVVRACATSTVGFPGTTIARCTRWV